MARWLARWRSLATSQSASPATAKCAASSARSKRPLAAPPTDVGPAAASPAILSRRLPVGFRHYLSLPEAPLCPLNRPRDSSRIDPRNRPLPYALLSVNSFASSSSSVQPAWGAAVTGPIGRGVSAASVGIAAAAVWRLRGGAGSA